jgi:hypothetical protein
MPTSTNPPKIDEEAAFTTLCEELNNTLEDAEILFTDHFKVSAEIPFPDGVALRFMKRDGEYGFAIIRKDDAIPIHSAKLEWRIMAAERLNDLWAACAVTHNAATQRIKDATQAVSSFVRTRSKT